MKIHTQKNMTKKEYKVSCDAVFKEMQNIYGIHFTEQDPCLGAKTCVCCNKSTSENKCFHLKYFFKSLFHSLVCVYVCMCGFSFELLQSFCSFTVIQTC